jgi:hypothetical protein
MINQKLQGQIIMESGHDLYLFMFVFWSYPDCVHPYHFSREGSDMIPEASG